MSELDGYVPFSQTSRDTQEQGEEPLEMVFQARVNNLSRPEMPNMGRIRGEHGGGAA